jgi:hypothetical protein
VFSSREPVSTSLENTLTFAGTPGIAALADDNSGGNGDATDPAGAFIDATNPAPVARYGPRSGRLSGRQ